MITPNLPEDHYTTFRLVSPPNMRRRIPCHDAQCKGYLEGWKTGVDESTPLGQGQAHYIRTQSGRRFSEYKTATGLTVFDFPPGQRCFRSHTVPVGDPLCLRYRGDHRTMRPQNVHRHARIDDWVDDFANTQDQIRTRLERG